MKNFFLYLLVFLPFALPAQSKKERKAMEAQQKADEAVMGSLSSRFGELNAILQQKQPSSSAQTLFCNYLSQQFGNVGLLPAENNSFMQSFVDEKGQRVNAATFFVINGDTLTQGSQYFPLVFSANANAEGMPAPDLKEQGEPWFIDVKDWLKNEADSQQASAVYVKILEEVGRASQKGATALILYNSSDQKDSIAFDQFGTTDKVPIPVVYLQNETYKKYYDDKSAMQEISLSVTISPYETYANNVIGFIDNASQSTTIVTSFIALPTTGGESVKSGIETLDISATALLIELAKMTVASTHKNTNYLFITFISNGANQSGGGYWLNNTALKSNIKYMVKLAPLAGVKTVPGVYVQGYGTSPQWKDVFANIARNDIKVSLDPGMDTTGYQAAFYAKQIPALVIGTAAPVILLGVDGKQLSNALAVVKYISTLLETADGVSKLSFTTTSQPGIAIAAEKATPAPAAANINEQTITAAIAVAKTLTPIVTEATPLPRVTPTPQILPAPANPSAHPAGSPVQYSVSLGVIPVSNYSGQGFKIGGVTPKRLAEKIGLKAGDVLLQLGDHKINEMSSYLQALANFKKGDVTTLKVMRENDEKLFTVEFQ